MAIWEDNLLIEADELPRLISMGRPSEVLGLICKIKTVIQKY